MRILDSLGNRFTGRDDLSDQYRRYSETLLWVVDELVRFDKNKTYLAISSNVLGGLLKAGALVLLLYYANLMERSADISLFDLSWSSRSETVFYISIIIALVFLIFGSLAVYLGSHLNNSLSINFAAHCSKMLMCSSGGRPARNRTAHRTDQERVGCCARPPGPSSRTAPPGRHPGRGAGDHRRRAPRAQGRHPRRKLTGELSGPVAVI